MIKSKLINYKENSYTINFPSVGQIQDIESFKISFSNGRYVDMASSGLRIHSLTLDITDAVSYFAILCPTMLKDLDIKNWRALDPFVAKELVSVYKKEFIPWFRPLLEDLYKYDEDESKEEVDESGTGKEA
jgi:hypothetical protein